MLVVGYTTCDHLLLDLDETTEKRACALAEHIMQSWPAVGDALLVQSSRGNGEPYLKWDADHTPHEHLKKSCYHLVFDGIIGYSKCCDIIETLCDLDVLPSEYMNIRTFRGDMTLRVSPKWLIDKTMPPPKIIKGIENHHWQLDEGGLERYISFAYAVNQAPSTARASKREKRKTGRQRRRAQSSNCEPQIRWTDRWLREQRKKLSPTLDPHQPQHLSS